MTWRAISARPYRSCLGSVGTVARPAPSSSTHCTPARHCSAHSASAARQMLRRSTSYGRNFKLQSMIQSGPSYFGFNR